MRSVWPEIRAYAAANTDTQRRGIIVEAVKRHPPDGSILRLGPLSQQGRLAVTRRCGDTDHPAIARASRLDEPRAAHQTCAKARHRKLRIEQQRLERSNRWPHPATESPDRP